MTSPQFRLSWVLDVAEAVEIRRTVPTPVVFLATVESGILTFIDTILDDLGVEAGDTITWTITGVTSLDVAEASVVVGDMGIPPLDDDRRYEAAMLIGARLWKRRDAPFGVAGGGDIGSIQIGFKDPDVEMILTGLRRTDSDLSTQTWPTVTEFRTRIQASATAHPDAVLSPVLDSAIARVTGRCKGAGIA